MTFANTEIEKDKFYGHKRPIFLEDVNIEKVLVSSKISSGEKSYKYFIGYLCNDYKIKPLYIMLLNNSAYVKSYDRQTKWMYFLIENDDLVENYNTIWDKFSDDIKKEFDSELVYNKKLLKAKIKFLHDKVLDFSDKEIIKVASNYT